MFLEQHGKNVGKLTFSREEGDLDILYKNFCSSEVVVDLYFIHLSMKDGVCSQVAGSSMSHEREG